MFAYPTFLLAHGTAGWQGPIRVIGWVTGIVGLALAWIAAACVRPGRLQGTALRWPGTDAKAAAREQER